MSKNSIYIISYDIHSNKRRTKIAKKLNAAGWVRIQYSVWMRKSNKRIIQLMVDQLDAVPNKERSDSILIFTLPFSLIQACKDDNRIRFYLSDSLEQVYI